MTKKHFVAVNESVARAAARQLEITDDAQHVCVLATVRGVVRGLATTFADENRNFDRTRYVEHFESLLVEKAGMVGVKVERSSGY